MNTKKRLLFLFFSLLLTFLLPHFSWGKEYDDSPRRISSDGCHFNVTTVQGSTSKFGLMSVDTAGTLLCFDNPAKVSGTGAVGGVKQGDVYKYTNVITVDGQQVDAKVTVQEVVNIQKAVLDDPAPNPSGNRTNGGAYTTAFGAIVPEGAVFAPQLWSSDKTKEAYVKFFIEFLDTTGKPIVLKNVYNNSLDVESTEYNAYGGFVSYRLASDNKTNTASRILATALGSQIRFSSSDCTGDFGLYIKDQSRVQAKFATLTSLVITTGQFANGQVPKIGGGVNSSCTNTSQRYYGAIFVQDSFDGTNVVEYTAPKVDILITDKTKPTLTGKIGGEISTSSPDGSALGTLGTGDSFTVNVAGVTYTAGDGKLSTNGVNWTLNIPVDLVRGTTYEVIATRNGILIDQTEQELTISPICVKPQYLNAAGTACITPTVNDIFICHSGDGANYTKISVPASGLNGHETHEFDVAVDSSGRCPDIPKDKACTAVGQPFPAGSDYDGKKVTICHFPPGNPDNVQIISISVNALDVHIGHHYDTIWEAGKSCPTTIDDCDNPNPSITEPTVNFLTTRESLPTLTGTIGTTPVTSGTTFTVAVNGKTYSYNPNGNSGNVNAGSIAITGTTWSLTVDTAIPAGNYDVVATRIETTGTGSKAITTTLKDLTLGELTILPSCTKSQAVVNGVCVDLPTVVITTIDGKPYDGTNRVVTGNTKPVIKGIVGSTPLGASEGFFVFVNGVKYSKNDGRLSVPDNMNWTLTLPTALPFGIYDIVADRDNGLEDTTDDEMEITLPLPPTVNPKSTYHLVPVNLDGNIGTSTTISSVTLTKTKDGLGANATGTTTVAGTPITVANGATTWTISSGAVPVGTYTITITDGYSKTATGILTVTCPTGKLTTATDCIDSIAPTVDVKSTTEGNPIPLTGKPGSSLTITSVTLTKFEDGLNAPVVGSPVTVGSNITSGQTAWTTPIPSALQETVGKYTITATDANGKTGTNVLTVTCPTGKITTASSCIQSTNPTVNDKSVKEKEPITLTGTVGDVVLDNSETFTVKVNNQTYSKNDGNLTVTALNWSLSIPATDLTAILAVNSPYPVTATRSGTLTGTGTLTVNAINIPTVEKQTTFDTTPVIKGTVGDAELATGETFTVAVNNKTYTLGISSNLVESNKNWTLTILDADKIAPRSTPYDVVATRGTQIDKNIDDLTIEACALPKVVLVAADGTSSCIDPVPTVDSTIPASPISTSVLPVTSITIKGTVGTVELGSDETFTVSIKIGSKGGLTGFATQTYTYKIDSALTVTGKNWTLVIPTAKALSAEGTYEIEAARNTTAKDTTHDELIINLVCDTGYKPANGVCKNTAIIPTVDSQSTDDRTPTITGTVGTVALGSGDTFTVEVNNVVYQQPSVIVNTKTWSLTVPTVLQPATYEVIATRNSEPDESHNELIIVNCPPTKIIQGDGDCVAQNKIPTVNKLITDINAQTIAVTGTVGNIPVDLDTETFTVKVHNTKHSNDISCTTSTSGTNWTCTLAKPYYAGIFDVDAVRSGVADETNGELEVTNNIAVCENGVDKSIPKDSWDGGQTQELGHCKPQSGDDVLPTKEDSLPTQPNSKVDEAVKVTGLDYCVDGGVKTDADITGATIKRAIIANATTEGGTADLSSSTSRVKYGNKTPKVGTMDISNATLTSANRATGVLLTGVTLDDVYIDTDVDYIDSNGNPISGGTYIPLTGGTTKPTTTKSDGSQTPATITSGVIVAGKDNVSNQPVRGSITSGQFEGDITNASSVLTKGRRVQGKLTGATIEDARTTTVEGVTIVDSGKIKAGTLETGSTSPVSAFGTVQGATLTDVKIKNSNHCFSSGTVGNKGQLNWKEVVK